MSPYLCTVKNNDEMKKVLTTIITIMAINSAISAQNAEGIKRTAILGADPLGITLKDAVKEALIEEGFEVTDITGNEQQDYYTVGYNVGKAISEKQYDFGFLFCGTGMGVNLIANKFTGVHCALCESIETARLSRVINNANILAMGGIVVTPYLGRQMVKAFVNAEFSKGFTEAPSDFLQGAFVKVEELGREVAEYNYGKLEK